MAKALLAVYPGMIHTPSGLMPGSGLPLLAACLKKENHQVMIRDFGTMSHIKKLIPDDCRNELAHLLPDISAGNWDRVQSRSIEINSALQKAQETVARETGGQLVKEIRKGNYDFIGFQVFTGSGFRGTQIISEVIREALPGFPIIWGGPHVDLFRELIFKVTTAPNILIFAEGEKPITIFAQLFNNRARWNEIPNAIFLSYDGVPVTTSLWRQNDLDALPLPLYDLDTYPAMAEKLKVLILETGRGCRGGCPFCAHIVKSGQGKEKRDKSPTDVVEAIKYFKENYGTSVWRDGASSTSGEMATNLAAGFLSEGLKTLYTFYARIPEFRDYSLDNFRMLKNSGLHSIFWGIESGNQQLLESICKGVRIDEMERVLIACKAAGIYTVGSLIFPLPGETEQTMQDTIAFLERTRPHAIPLNFPVPIPGTPWMLKPKKYGFKFDPNMSMEMFLIAAMYYEQNNLIPPTRRPQLPYSLRGDQGQYMDIGRVSTRTETMAKAIKDLGIIGGGVSDDVAILAQLAGMTDPLELVDLWNMVSLGGAMDRGHHFVQQVNEGIARVSGE